MLRYWLPILSLSLAAHAVAVGAAVLYAYVVSLGGF